MFSKERKRNPRPMYASCAEASGKAGRGPRFVLLCIGDVPPYLNTEPVWITMINFPPSGRAAPVSQNRDKNLRPSRAARARKLCQKTKNPFWQGIARTPTLQVTSGGEGTPAPRPTPPPRPRTLPLRAPRPWRESHSLRSFWVSQRVSERARKNRSR